MSHKKVLLNEFLSVYGKNLDFNAQREHHNSAVTQTFSANSDQNPIDLKSPGGPVQPRTEFAYGRGLACKNKAFYSPETQHGRRVRKVYFSL